MGKINGETSHRSVLSPKLPQHSFVTLKRNADPTKIFLSHPPIVRDDCNSTSLKVSLLAWAKWSKKSAIVEAEELRLAGGNNGTWTFSKPF